MALRKRRPWPISLSPDEIANEEDWCVLVRTGRVTWEMWVADKFDWNIIENIENHFRKSILSLFCFTSDSQRKHLTD